jgi:hypothetical protein
MGTNGRGWDRGSGNLSKDFVDYRSHHSTAAYGMLTFMKPLPSD